jgi:hypothetical protein
MGYSENATDDWQGYHRGTRFQAIRAGNLLTALTVVGPVGCRTGRGHGPEKLALGTERWAELAGFAIFAHAGNLFFGGVFLLQKVSSFASPTTTRRLYQFALPSGF